MQSLSIIIAAYNAERTIARAIGSARAVEGMDVRIIVIDDGSTDATADVAAEISTAEPRVGLHRLPVNRGVSAARNAAMRHASGDWLLFLDADDTLEPSGPMRLVNAARHARTDAAAGGFEVVGRRGEVIHRHRQNPGVLTLDDLVDRAVLITPALVFRRETLLGLSFDERIGLYEDRDLWLRIAERPVNFATAPEAVAQYRITPGSLSKDPRALIDASIGALDRCIARQHGIEPGSRLIDTTDGDRFARKRTAVALEYLSRWVIKEQSGSVAREAAALLRRYFEVGGRADPRACARAGHYAFIFHAGAHFDEHEHEEHARGLMAFWRSLVAQDDADSFAEAAYRELVRAPRAPAETAPSWTAHNASGTQRHPAEGIAR